MLVSPRWLIVIIDWFHLLIMFTLVPFPPLVVATDDERIAECCRGFGADVIMTSESCKNGTDCVVL
jgi:hypothetical protein